MKTTTADQLEAPSFSRLFWNEFHEKTQGLSVPQIFKGALTESDIVHLMKLVHEVITDVCERRVTNGFRVSIAGTIKDEHRELFHNNPPGKTENMNDWCSRVFGDNKFGVILNSIQNYSRAMKGDISTRFRPLLDGFGIPPNGIEITLFVGNYGFTPLGFHLDPVGHKVTHLHLGPCKKQMYLMSREKYEKELGYKTGSKDFDKLVPHSDEYEFERGDLFFMPEGVYHVGNTAELSFGLTVWHVEPAVSEFQSRLSIDLMKKIFVKEDNNRPIRSDSNEVSDISSLMNALADVTDFDPDYENLPLKHCVDLLMQEHRFKLASNGYFYGFLQNQEGIREVPQLNFEQSLVGVPPFKVYCTNREESCAIYAQGRKIVVPYHADMSSIIDRINTYEPTAIGNLFAAVADDWEADLVLHVAGELYRYSAVDLVKEPENEG